MTATLDLSSALALRVADQDALALRVANVDVWTISPDSVTYSLWDSATDLGITLASDSAAYTMATGFKSAVDGHLLGARFYSAAGAGQLPDEIGLFLVSDESLVASDPASWSGAAGSGWVTANFATPQALVAETAYKIAVLMSNDGAGFWYSSTHSYYTSTGVDNGPLHAFSISALPSGQGTFNVGTVLEYPSSDFFDSNYWIDPIVQVP